MIAIKTEILLKKSSSLRSISKERDIYHYHFIENDCRGYGVVKWSHPMSMEGAYLEKWVIREACESFKNGVRTFVILKVKTDTFDTLKVREKAFIRREMSGRQMRGSSKLLSQS